jgi:hypothetical protein
MNENEPEAPTPTVQDLQAALRDVLEPVRQQLALIEHLVEEKKRELDDLHKLRRHAERILNYEAGKKPGPKKGTRPISPREERVHELADWLRENYSSDDDIRIVDVQKANPFGWGDDTYRRGMHTLADNGTLRLDRLAAVRGGKSKVFRVTSNDSAA